jgi:hypothetical protein
MAGFSVVIGSGVALTPGAPKTVIMITPGANVACKLVEFSIGFDGTTAANTPVLVELVSCTLATQGTRTIATPQQTYGESTAVNIFSGFVNYTVEPTVEITIKEWLVTPNGGLLILQSPLGREMTNGVSTSTQKGLGLRCTAQQAVNVRGGMEISEGGG